MLEFKSGFQSYKGYTVCGISANDFPPQAYQTYMDNLALSGPIVCVEVKLSLQEYADSLIACSLPKHFSDGALLIESKKIIIVDLTVAKTIPQRTLEVVLDHEIGHFVNDDFNKPEYTQSGSSTYIDLKFEIAADAYAASIHGKRKVRMAIRRLLKTNVDTIHAGKSWFSRLVILFSFLQNTVIKQRIQALR